MLSKFVFNDLTNKKKIPIQRNFKENQLFILNLLKQLNYFILEFIDQIYKNKKTCRGKDLNLQKPASKAGVSTIPPPQKVLENM